MVTTTRTYTRRVEILDKADLTDTLPVHVACGGVHLDGDRVVLANRPIEVTAGRSEGTVVTLFAFRRDLEITEIPGIRHAWCPTHNLGLNECQFGSTGADRDRCRETAVQRPGVRVVLAGHDLLTPLHYPTVVEETEGAGPEWDVLEVKMYAAEIVFGGRRDAR
jgi:hypothetical protein